VEGSELKIYTSALRSDSEIAMLEFNNPANASIISIRCPHCRHVGAFHPAQNVHDAQFRYPEQVNGSTFQRLINYGVRICPNPNCREPIFAILTHNGIVKAVFPPERLDFEPTGVPGKILESFEEALTTHAHGCFKSSAIMVRRTLEEICADKGATGANLKSRVAALGAKIVVPIELLEAADELRLLGNDAAHLEAEIYADVGKDEVEAGIALCKEILKAVYQLSELVERLRKLKK